MGEKNIWLNIIKFSSVIVLDKSGKCMFYSRSDLLTICKPRRGMRLINYMCETLSALTSQRT